MGKYISTYSKRKNAITALSVQCFKSINKSQRITISPLTLLAGANSSGKSSMMQPLLLMKQTLEAPYDPGAFLLNGPNLKFTSVDQIFCSPTTKACSNVITIGIELNGSFNVFSDYSKDRKSAITIDEMRFVEGEQSRVIKLGMSHEQAFNNLSSRAKLIYKIYQNEMAQRKDRIKLNKIEVYRDRCFLDIDFRESRTGISPELTRIHSAIQQVIHLPGLRGNPERTYPISAAGPHFPGVFHDYAASIIFNWQISKNTKLDKLGRYLEKLGLTWKVTAKKLDDTQIGINVGRLPHGSRGGAYDTVSIADVGFGVSQTLPVLVALLAANPGQIVYLEQPEIHLHPRAQVALAEILADAAKRGVIVVAETHSSLLLLRIQTLIAKGDLSPDLVKLHWFERGTDGYTKVTTAEIDENGAFGNWPVDFGDVELDAESDYLDAVDMKNSK